jgi:hypothetical protein
MTGMQTPGFTRYSVRRSRQELLKERRARCIGWTLVAGACVVIVVFAYLILAGGLV